LFLREGAQLNQITLPAGLVACAPSPRAVASLVSFQRLLEVTVHRIVVVNPKGGSGKTTLATNLAAYYAASGTPVALIDLDAQGSSTRWLTRRPADSAAIVGINGTKEPCGVTRAYAMRIPPEVRRIVVDTPAAIPGHQLAEITRRADRIVLPVLPSEIDIHVATRCVADLLLQAKIDRDDNRLGVVANRVKRNTLVFHSLMRFLDSLRIPVAAVLRDTQNYIKAAESSLGLHEMKAADVRDDLTQWGALIDWVENGTVRPMSGWTEPPQPRVSVTSLATVREARLAVAKRW
jgi:chromosome partitioning protein